MMIESGRIVAIEKDGLWVETIQQSSCGSCSAKQGCGQGVLARWASRSGFVRVLLEGRDPDNYQLDDEVQIGIPEDVIAAGALFVYLLPLVTMLIFAVVADGLDWGESGVIISALIGLVLGGVGVKWHSYYHRNNRRLQPVLVDGLEAVSVVNRVCDSVKDK
jgi:sigma-E factor negative regulatory protein RseC